MFGQSIGQKALADEAGGDSGGAGQQCQHGDSACHVEPVNLDLSSAVQNMTANCIANSVNIDVGGTSMAVTQGMALTPAQMIAAYQVAHTGQQSLLLGVDGAAVGGSFILSSRLANHISDLVVPVGVSVINRAADLNLAGNLTNAGSIYAVSNNPVVMTATISAANILNQQSGLLSTVLPVNLGLDLSQYSSVLNLSLSAINNIVNYGTIVSGGSLTAVAGGSIQNLLSGSGATSPVMQAMTAMNLQAPQIVNQGQIVSQLNSMNLAASSLVNAGAIQALAGSINMAGLTSNILNVNNIAGSILARDAISMVTSGTTFNANGSVLEKAGIDLKGGELTAAELKFISPDGIVNLDTQRLNGPVDITAGIAAAHVAGGTLNIAKLTLSGDPIFTNAAGDVAISNFNAGGAPSDFIVLASGNITANAGTTSIVTNGGNVVLSAGYLFTGSNSSCTSCSGLYTTTYAPSSTGGSISLSGVNINTTGNDGNGGGTGAAGDAGSVGGNITAQANGTLTLGNLAANGGVGGAGGQGASGGGAGGIGGGGGNGGAISVSATGAINVGTIALIGGNGATGGGGGISTTNAGTGGAGGSGGAAGNSGNLYIYGLADVVAGAITASGGTAGPGGIGGDFFVAANGNGGTGGASGNGGDGGFVSVFSNGDMVLSNVSSLGGGGDSGGTGGSTAAANGDGGIGGAGGNAGYGGSVLLVSNAGLVSGQIDVSGGQGAAGGPGGSGGSSTGDGGNGGDGGNSGNAGVLYMSAGNNVLLNGISAFGGVGSAGAGGSGGGGNSNGGNGGNGGYGGVVTVISTDSDVFFNSGLIQADGGSGGLSGSKTGTGTDGSNGNGGNAQIVTLFAGDNLGTNNIPLPSMSVLAGTGLANGNDGVLLLESQSNNNAAINISGSAAFNAGSMAFITSYGSNSPVFTKVLPITGYTFVSGDLNGSGVTVVSGAPTFNITNPVTIAQNPNGALTVNNVAAASGQGVFTASNGTMSAAAAGNLYNLAVVGQDLLMLSQGTITSSAAGTLNVASANGDAPGGQLVMAPGLSSGFVTGGAAYSNPFVVLNRGGTSSITGSQISLTTNSNLVYAAAGTGGSALGAITASGLTPTMVGANGLPGGQIVLATVTNTDQSVTGSLSIGSALSANGASGAAGGATHFTGGDGGRGGIININTANSTIFLSNSLLTINSDTLANGGNPGSGFGGGSSGNGGNGGSIIVNASNIQSEGGFSANSGNGANANGGYVYVYVNTIVAGPVLLLGSSGGQPYINGSLVADALVSGNGGTAYLQSNAGILGLAQTVTAKSGTASSGRGGSITLIASNLSSIELNDGSVDASGTAYGGTVTIESDDQFTQLDNVPVYAKGTGQGSIGGTVTIQAYPGIQFDTADVSADGVTAGGRVNIATGVTQTPIRVFGGTISANGSNVGGKILFAPYNFDGGYLGVDNEGTITATDNGHTSGIIGFYCGPINYFGVIITGSGTLEAGEAVNVGDINISSLAISQPFVTVSPFTGSYTLGNTSITQSSITGTLNVSGPASQAPQASQVVLSNGLFLYLQSLLSLGQLQQGINAQQNLVSTQLGTRLFTDYTPYTTYPEQGQFSPFPLQGNVAMNSNVEIGQGLFAATSFNANELQALAQNGIEFGPQSGGNFFDLTKGYVLFTPANDIQVQTKEGVVSIPKGAVVWVMETGNDAAIYDMHDSMGAPVKVLVNNKEITLSPGKQLLLTRDGKTSFDELNPGGAIGTRNVQSKDVGHGIKAYLADFTISGGMTSISTIRSLLKSNNPEHQKAAHKMLKNAAIISDLGGYKNPYKTKP